MANVKATDLIDFTRASKGHALAKVSYGTEEITNGGFDTDSGWVKQTGWSISSGTANWDGVLSVYLQQADVFTPNTLYTITFTISNNTSGTISIRDGAATVLVPNTTYANGTYSFNVVSTSNTSLRIYGVAGTGSLSIDNVSVKEVTFDQPDGTIQLFEHPNNTPRIEYDADGNLLGLLIEESRTNTIQYSEDFENSYWTKGGGFSIYGNHGIAPDGTRTATLLTDINDEDSYIIEPNICSNGQTKSVWIRTVSGTATLNVLTHHDQLDGEVTVTEEWQRFERAVDISEPGGDDFFVFDTRSGTNTASDIYIWGAQLETGGFATSYIRSNSGSSTSRSADVASIDVDQFGYNQSEGTVVVKATFASASYPSNANLVSFTDSTNSDSTRLWVWSGADSTIRWTITEGGLSQADITKSYVEKQVSSIGASYINNDFALTINGGSVSVDTSGSVMTDTSTLNIGSRTGSAERFTGHIKSLTYTPKRLSNAKLQELSS